MMKELKKCDSRLISHSNLSKLIRNSKTVHPRGLQPLEIKEWRISTIVMTLSPINFRQIQKEKLKSTYLPL